MNLLYGFKDTASILAFKWESIKKKRIKVLIVAFIALFALFLYGMSNVGKYMLIFLNLNVTGRNDAVRDFVIQYLTSFANGELNVYVAGVFGATILTILILPFSGYSLSGVVPARDMLILKANNNYRLSDSIVVQFVSALSILQLISLTILSSLLSVESGTGPAVVYAWATWLVIVFMTVAFMWIIEYLNRKYGNKTKIAMVGGVIIALGIAILVDPFHGTTFFGLSPVYVDVLQHLYVYSPEQTMLAYGILAALLIGFALAINFVGSKALMIPEPVAIQKKKSEIKLASKQYQKITLMGLLRLIVFRYKVIWRPILITTIFSTGLLVVVGSTGIQGVLPSVTVIIPLVICLAFGVNMFGILGSSNIWMSSLPKWRDNILFKLALIQIIIIASAYSFVLIVASIFGKISGNDLAQSIPSFLASSSVMIVYAISKSMRQPVKYTAASRGDAILPPLSLLSYMLKFMLLGGLAGSLVFLSTGIFSWLIGLTILVISALWFVTLNNKWRTNEKYINNVIKNTTSD